MAALVPPRYPHLPPHVHAPGPFPPDPKKSHSNPQLFIHPSKLIELRDSGLVKKNSVAFKLITNLAKKVLEETDREQGYSVTFSKRWSPGGKHYFLSFAAGYHPDPAQVDEYKRCHPNWETEGVDWPTAVDWDRDTGGSRGKRDEDCYKDATQASELGEMCTKVHHLAMAYHFWMQFDEQRATTFIDKAYRLLKIFFHDPETYMEPETMYGQCIPGRNGNWKGRPEGGLHFRPLNLIFQVLPLFPAPPSPYSPHYFLYPWIDRHINFLLNHEICKETFKRKNNIKDFFLTVVSTALICMNRAPEASAIIREHFFGRGLASRILPNGGLVHELARPTPFFYTFFDLEALTYLATVDASIQQYSPLHWRGDIGNGASVWAAQDWGLHRAFSFALSYYFRTLKNDEWQPGALPEGAQKEPEQGEVRLAVFSAWAVAQGCGRQGLEWLIGERGEGMEQAEGKVMRGPLRNWTVKARMFWALLEGY
ncbi:hypothetical protein BT69DRAFT_1333649 [Atractiella rhizophila]|nr:hypothetical protein BT69DRAFT_1333649 [Atractiella rhizophila]